jgi:2-oxoacid:acceptor oxidoreductase delta subunit (pyruvate/2-ketoisovalerate family)
MSKDGKNKIPSPIALKGEIDLPYCPVSMETTEWNATGSWRYLRPRYVERIPACQHACPTANDIEGFIAHFDKGEIEKAWELAVLENPFPAIMGRVCFHPCMDACNRKDLGGSVNIHALERALGDAFSAKPPAAAPHFPNSGKRVAVVGSGPAGLSCAYHLARFGHQVTVFEKETKAGGMLRYGIPDYRLPGDVLDREIAKLSAMGIVFKLGHAVPDATHMQTLRTEHDAVFLAPGAHKSRTLGIDGERVKGVLSGLAFLKDVALGKKTGIGKRVLVVGGGNTAVDAARSAIRLGSDVTILYRRSRAEMPAFPEEIKAAEDEGVKIEILTAPVEVLDTAGRVAGAVIARMELGAPDESGRRSPRLIAGSEEEIDCTTLITAIGEDIDLSLVPSALHVDRGALRTEETGRTEWHNVFAGGDFTLTPRTVVDALASGKAGAIGIDCELRGEDAQDVVAACRIGESGPLLVSRYVAHRKNTGFAHSSTRELALQDQVVHIEDINLAYFKPSDPEKTPCKTADDLLKENPFDEICSELPKDARKRELARCFHCGRCTECDNCYIYCPDVAVAKLDGGFSFDLDYCKGCGVCAMECPRAAIEMMEEPTEL